MCLFYQSARRPLGSYKVFDPSMPPRTHDRLQRDLLHLLRLQYELLHSLRSESSSRIRKITRRPRQLLPVHQCGSSLQVWRNLAGVGGYQVRHPSCRPDLSTDILDSGNVTTYGNGTLDLMCYTISNNMPMFDRMTCETPLGFAYIPITGSSVGSLVGRK